MGQRTQLNLISNTLSKEDLEKLATFDETSSLIEKNSKKNTKVTLKENKKPVKNIVNISDTMPNSSFTSETKIQLEQNPVKEKSSLNNTPTYLLSLLIGLRFYIRLYPV